MKITGIILAGGKHKRLGRVKALELVGGKPIIERVIENLRQISDQILIVTSREEFSHFIDNDADVLTDLFPARGPLGGIYTGLLASRYELNVAVACDMPFLNVGLLRYMIELAEGFDAVVPRVRQEKVEPLHAIYSKSCLSNIRTRLEHDQLEVNIFLDSIKVRYLDRAECQRYDPQLLSFFNVNDQSDLDRAVALAVEQGNTQSE